ncbi:hypothetical protein H5S09_10495 [Limosilactobacillus sp. STM2_1]|uniref:YxjI n=1 Tax=Limosilactobacillus rudii TaxID=2759755 RepID=A0A7W3YNB7_9LACO|nr:hypothetical protein [Limosilactobacillus rudii]MBB1080328.1 hypothetical protein [Limosilactobacillus rudii]MBB1098354.1 hypothetical protein [Limosilactobacillus rudii]MCD7135362.1 hypothetical protein [Limosilactobacillus rudii]
MRQLYIRDRSTDLHGTTVIRDKDGKSCYLLVGKWGIRHDALSLYAISGALLAEVKQLSLGLLPKFALYVNRQRVGTIGKGFGFVQQVVYIRGINWIIVGSPLTSRYRVFRGSHLVFSINPVKLSGGYCHELKVNKKDDEPLAILIASILNHWARRSDQEPLLAKLLKRSPNLRTSMSFSISNQLNSLINTKK